MAATRVINARFDAIDLIDCSNEGPPEGGP
jgi:hypothetical protein